MCARLLPRRRCCAQAIVHPPRPRRFAVSPRVPALQSKATLVEAVWRTVRTTLKADGVRGFYRGFSMFTFGGLPSQG
jgi:hypothetical protein